MPALAAIHRAFTTEAKSSVLSARLRVLARPEGGRYKPRGNSPISINLKDA